MIKGDMIHAYRNCIGCNIVAIPNHLTSTASQVKE
jgi:hypothetical protein